MFRAPWSRVNLTQTTKGIEDLNSNQNPWKYDTIRYIWQSNINISWLKHIISSNLQWLIVLHITITQVSVSYELSFQELLYELSKVSSIDESSYVPADIWLVVKPYTSCLGEVGKFFFSAYILSLYSGIVFLHHMLCSPANTSKPGIEAMHKALRLLCSWPFYAED